MISDTDHNWVKLAVVTTLATKKCHDNRNFHIIFDAPKKDVRQAQQQSGGSGERGESQEQLEPIETIIQLVMTQQMIEAQKVREGALLTIYSYSYRVGHFIG